MQEQKSEFSLGSTQRKHRRPSARTANSKPISHQPTHGSSGSQELTPFEEVTCQAVRFLSSKTAFDIAAEPVWLA